MAREVQSIPAMQSLKKLGFDLAIARKRRRMTQRRLADGAGVSLPTVRRLEAGDSGVSLATLAMVLVVLGEISRLANLIDTGRDDVGLLLENGGLPQRVRPPRRRKPIANDGGRASGPDTDESSGEAF